LLDDAFIVERLEDVEDYEDEIARASNWRSRLGEIAVIRERRLTGDDLSTSTSTVLRAFNDTS